VGEAIGTLYSYRFFELDHATGLPLFYDSKGETTYINRLGEVSPNYSIYEQEAGLIRSGLLEAPNTGGIRLNFRYKGFHLSTNFTYSFGGVKRLPAIYSYYGAYHRVYDPSFNLTKELVDRWKQPGDELHTNIPALYDVTTYDNISRRPVSIDLTERSGTLLYDKSSVRVASTDNIRMNNLKFSYIIPNKIVKNYNLSNVTVSFETTNVFLIADKRWHGRDPENTSLNATLPPTYTCNLNISF
jgi:hypothetical protein